MRRTLKIILTLVIIIELGAIFFFGLPLALNTPVVFLKIQTDSMLPEIKPGDLVILSGRDKKELAGQIIAYYDPISRRITVHRAIGQISDCLVTKGDNSQMIDFFQPCPSYIYGRIIVIF